MFAQMIVEAPKYGASRRAAAISAPRLPAPTTNTMNRNCNAGGGGGAGGSRGADAPTSLPASGAVSRSGVVALTVQQTVPRGRAS